MDGKLLDENKNAEKTTKETEDELAAKDIDPDDPQFQCGWWKFRPKFLQIFNTPRWFIVFISIFSCIQGLLINGLTSVCIPSIEKEFGFSSKESGMILASNDVSGLLLVGVVSYFGGQSHKPKWIAYGSIITGIGSLLFALPKIIVGKYEPADLKIDIARRGLCLANTNMTHIHGGCDAGVADASAINLMIFCIAQLIMGAGTTPLYTLGPAFLDENVNPKMSPIYLGIWFATTFFGPGLGYMFGGMFLSKFTDLKVPEGMNLTPYDPRWIGAWWLGYFLLSWFLLLTGLILLGFPRAMPKTRRKRDEAVKKGDLPGVDTQLGKGWRGMVRSFWQLVRNKTFMLAIFALTVRTMYGVAIGSFFAKIIKVKFGASGTTIGVALGIVLLPGMSGGIMTGAYIMKKISIKESAKKGALLCTVFGVLTAAFSASWLLPGCQDTTYAGLTKPYQNQTSFPGLVAGCNSHCACSRRYFSPVCGPEGLTYFSSCHAGCESRLGPRGFANCTCVASQGTNGTMIRSVKRGFCDRKCKNLYVFLGLSAGIILLVFITATPHKMVVLRSVPDNQRSFALGIQFFVMRSLSFVPGPVIFGAVVDSNCVLWQYNDCGKRLNCLDYKINSLSKSTVLFGCMTSLISTALYFFAWWFHVPVEASGKTISQKELLEEEKEDDVGNMTSVQKLSAV